MQNQGDFKLYASSTDVVKRVAIIKSVVIKRVHCRYKWYTIFSKLISNVHRTISYIYIYSASFFRFCYVSSPKIEFILYWKPSKNIQNMQVWHFVSFEARKWNPLNFNNFICLNISVSSGCRKLDFRKLLSQKKMFLSFSMCISSQRYLCSLYC